MNTRKPVSGPVTGGNRKSYLYFGRPNFVQPDSLIVHISNDSAAPMRIVSCRLFIIGETS